MTPEATVANDQHCGRTALYRLYAANEQPLYFGVSLDPEARFKAHRKTSWWPQVAIRQIEWFDTRAEAEAAELAAIRAERPIHNGAGTQDVPPPSGRATGRAPWRPKTDEHRALLLNLATAAEAARLAEANLWLAVTAARKGEVPLTVAVATAGLSRATAYRRGVAA